MLKGSLRTSARVFEKGIDETDSPLEVDRKEETKGTANTVIGWAERIG